MTGRGVARGRVYAFTRVSTGFRWGHIVHFNAIAVSLLFTIEKKYFLTSEADPTIENGITAQAPSIDYVFACCVRRTVHKDL